MSYAITVTVKLGTAVVTTSGEVPDGEFAISGHEDDSQRSLNLTHRGADGRYLQSSSAVHHKEIS